MPLQFLSGRGVLAFAGLLALCAGHPGRADAAQTPAEPAGLRIVVIEGEDAVNIIQQKTAVAPVVEVRDRNDQPVAGVIVRFAIRSGRATFTGSPTLSVTTNSAGRAIATGLTATGSGPVQIGASATFQAQTATVTIAQTNFMTAAEAASVSGSGSAGASSGASAGGAAGGGSAGGISGTTMAVIGGAAAGGGLLAVNQLQGGGSDEPGPNGPTYTGQYSGTHTITFPGCIRTHGVTGTMTMRLTVGNDGSVTGTAEISQSDVVTSVTCSLGPQLNERNTLGTPSIPVQGTTGSLGFRHIQSNSFPPSGNDPDGGTRTEDLTFSGRLDGNQITGTLTENIGISPRGSGAGSYIVTLVRQ